jgi:hypothetical protein
MGREEVGTQAVCGAGLCMGFVQRRYYSFGLFDAKGIYKSFACLGGRRHRLTHSLP